MSNKMSFHKESTYDPVSSKNDKLIVDALSMLEDSERRGRKKVTLATVCELTGLSMNTVRGREWALKRLKAIKLKLKGDKNSSEVARVPIKNEVIILGEMRERVRRLLEQNALPYEEVLSLREQLNKRDVELQKLRARKVVAF